MPDLEMGDAAIYRIRVRGILDARWARRFGEMTIDQVEGDSILIGPLADQAELSGVLNTLYDLQVPVVSVECLGLQAPESKRGETR